MGPCVVSARYIFSRSYTISNRRIGVFLAQPDEISVIRKYGNVSYIVPHNFTFSKLMFLLYTGVVAVYKYIKLPYNDF